MMSRPILFSFFTGSAVLAAGAGVASAGIADWGLFWVGAIICSVALSTLLGDDRTPRPILLQAAQPEPAKLQR